MEFENWPHLPFAGDFDHSFSDDWDVAKITRDGKAYVVRFNLAENFKSAVERKRLIESEFKQLERVGVNVVPHDYVAAINPEPGDFEAKTLLTIGRFVDGKSLDKANYVPRDQIGALRMGLSDYFKSKIGTNDLFLSDIYDERQYVYGSVDSGEKKIYLTDLDFGLASGSSSALQQLDIVASLGSAFLSADANS